MLHCITYLIYGVSVTSLLIESTDSMIPEFEASKKLTQLLSQGGLYTRAHEHDDLYPIESKVEYSYRLSVWLCYAAS